MRRVLTLVLAAALCGARASACISSAPRQFAAPTFQAPALAQPQFAAPQLAALPRIAGAENVAPAEPIASARLAEAAAAGGLGERVQLAEFSSNGYNAEGGGPVGRGQALHCDFEGRPCCWANVPAPDDQIDWQLAAGTPARARQDNVTLTGRYLLAYAEGAAPSDEAQFASCSVACASSPIRVRASHYQSKDVLLQVCQRESFPNSIDYNPLLNCQEFPTSGQLQYTELTLPKASLVDIVFVASNLIERSGSVALLDNIEILYESDQSECPRVQTEQSQDNQAAEAQAAAGAGSSSAGGAAGAAGAAGAGSGNAAGANNNFINVDGSSDTDFSAVRSAGRGGAAGAAGAAGAGAAASRTSITNIDTQTGDAFEQTFRSAGSQSGGNVRALGTGTQKADESGPIVPGKLADDAQALATACAKTKCNFEGGDTCAYVDSYETGSIRGLATKFQVVKGQFMNRVTGVKESPEGDYYAATFLYPKEKAVLSSEVGLIDESRRIRFKYYEGTHGVQLKGCCDSIDNCPFGTDKFVTVTDREWKHGDFVCSHGTKKVLFLCENTRTNQGACALDDVQVVDSSEADAEIAQPIC